MKRLVLCSVLTVVVSLGTQQPVQAQGMGAILDFIQKLSGPKMIGPALSVYTEGERVRGRFTGAWRWSFNSDDKIDPDGSKITMLSLQPTVEVPLGSSPLDAVAGFALHRFGGDVKEDFWHWSIPAYLQLRFPLTGPVSVRLAVGGHYFAEFGATDFDDLVVDVSRTGGEWVWASFAGIDIAF